MIYLDNAATSYPKPASVYRAVSRNATFLGGNPSRSGHFLCARSEDAVYRCREALASMFGGDAEKTAFTLNATHALNLAIKGISRKGAHFIVSNMEHNAVMRPIFKLCNEEECSYTVIDVLNKSEFDILREIRASIRENTAAIIMNHASNLCSNTLSAKAIGNLSGELNIPFILDASQSAGHTSINIKGDKINFLCAPGHKGMYGLMGAGFLISDGKYTLDTLMEGGSGYNSSSPTMPENLPERLEAGTLPVYAISALEAGCEFIAKMGIEEIKRREYALYTKFSDRLYDLKNITVYHGNSFGSCLLFNIKDIPSDIVGEYLSSMRICVRSGFHCAPLAHSSLRTGDYGAVRLSFGIFNTEKDADELYYALKKLSNAKHGQRRVDNEKK